MNRAVAVARDQGPAAGLAVLDATAGVEGWHRYHAARADLLRQLDRTDEAATAYRRALGCAPGPADRRFLERRLAELL